MTRISRPDQDWWTAAEIADASLPDLPTSRQGVAALIKREGWRVQPGLARKRAGRGGGFEYSWKLFPARAKRHLIELVMEADVHAPNVPVKPGRDVAWAYYDGLPATAKVVAARRLTVIQAVERLVSSAVSKQLAVGDVAKIQGLSARTIWNWFALLEGIGDVDRLAYLAPRHRAKAHRDEEVVVQ